MALAKLFALTWTSDVKVALEFENNVTNTGNGTETITNNGSIPFESTIKHNGSYSGGIVNTSGQYYSFTMASTADTIQMWVYVVSSGKGMEAEPRRAAKARRALRVHPLRMLHDIVSKLLVEFGPLSGAGRAAAGAG